MFATYRRTGFASSIQVYFFKKWVLFRLGQGCVKIGPITLRKVKLGDHRLS